MFCSNCGKPLVPNAAFCGNCGSKTIATPQVAYQPQPAYSAPPQTPYQAPQPVYQQPPQPQAPVQPASSPSSVGDETRLILTVTHKLSFTNVVACSVVFKQSGLVLAHLTPALQKAESARLYEDLKAQNIGLLKRTGATMSYWAKFHERYFSMSTGQILNEDPTNSVVSYAMIASVEYRCSSTQTNYDDNTSTGTQGKLLISLTNGETLKFTHQLSHSRDIHDALTAIFGARLKYRK